MPNDFAGSGPGHAGDDAAGGILLDQLVREVIRSDGVTFSIDLVKKPGDPRCVFDTGKIYFYLLYTSIWTK
jgi:hypothetical protein